MLGNGELPPEEFSRPEVARILIDSYKKKEMADEKASRCGSRGFSGAGKTTISHLVETELR